MGRRVAERRRCDAWLPGGGRGVRQFTKLMDETRIDWTREILGFLAILAMLALLVMLAG